MRGAKVEVPKGLDGVEVDVTKISLVDGERGQLSYRGHDVATLIEWPFTRVVLLVLTGEDPTNAQRKQFDTALARAARLSADDAGLLDAGRKDRCASDGGAARSDSAAVAQRTNSKTFGDAAHGFTIAAKLPALIAGLYQLRARRGRCRRRASCSIRTRASWRRWASRRWRPTSPNSHTRST